MKKIIDFCKPYLSELLFVLVTLIAIALSTCTFVCLYKTPSAGIVILTTIALAVFGGFIWPINIVPSSRFRTVWYFCFGFLAVALCVCLGFSGLSLDIWLLHCLYTLSFVTFISLLGDMMVFTFRQNNNENNTKRNKLINKTYGKANDILCRLDSGELVRVPFNKRSVGTPVGIFPFANEEYLELKELKDKRHTDKDVDNDRLLDRDFCMRVATKKDCLNLLLTEMNCPILDGEYLAESNYMKGCGWIVAFDAGKNVIRSDFYGGNEMAKLRYMGWFYEKCQ